MFKKRHFAIKLEKDVPSKDAGDTHKMEIPWDEIKTVGNDVKHSLKKTLALGVLAVYGYVLLDTMRQVAVAHAEHNDN